MATQSPPTRPSGVLGTGASSSLWGGELDLLEHVPELRWPLSIATYARMRRDREGVCVRER